MTAKEIFDVVIVGLGPAGSVLGYILAKHGINVIGVDYRSFPRFKLCGGLITWKTQQLIEKVLQKDTSFLTKTIIYSSKEYGMGCGDWLYQGHLDIPFKIVDRYLYDFFWFEQFKRVGGKYVKAKVVGLDLSSSSIILSSGERVRGRYIVGADGVFSIIRRKLATKSKITKPGNINQVLAIEGFVPLDQIKLSYKPYIFFGKVPLGYAWIFPAKQGWALGILSQVRDARRLKQIFLEFCVKWAKTYKQKIYAHFLPYGDFEKKPVYKNCFLIGDAAGWVDPLLGEGIYYAHKSALILATAFLQGQFKLPVVREKFIHDLKEELQELRYALFWRKCLFTMGKFNNFALLKWLFLKKHKMFENIIHGKSSFCFGKYLGNRI